MENLPSSTFRKKGPFLLLLAVVLLLSKTHGLAALSDGLVSYWPLDEVQGAKTRDLVSGYDLDLNNLTATGSTSFYVIRIVP